MGSGQRSPALWAQMPIAACYIFSWAYYFMSHNTLYGVVTINTKDYDILLYLIDSLAMIFSFLYISIPSMPLTVLR